jgi:hypothetical protein
MEAIKVMEVPPSADIGAHRRFYSQPPKNAD